MIAHAKGGRKPEVHFFFRATDEYDWIVNSVEKMIAQYPDFTFAILSRYNSDLFRIEERLHTKKLAYTLYAQHSNTANNAINAINANEVTPTNK